MGVRAAEVDVPDVEQAHEHGDVLGRGLGGEVLVNGVEAGEEVGEVLLGDVVRPQLAGGHTAGDVARGLGLAIADREPDERDDDVEDREDR